MLRLTDRAYETYETRPTINSLVPRVTENNVDVGRFALKRKTKSTQKLGTKYDKKQQSLYNFPEGLFCSRRVIAVKSKRRDSLILHMALLIAFANVDT